MEFCHLCHVVEMRSTNFFLKKMNLTGICYELLEFTTHW